MPIELTNFTVWGRQWFEDGWDGLRAFCAEHGIAGVELLASGATQESAPPCDLIHGIHLRRLGSWLRLTGLETEGFGAGSPGYAAAESYGELVALRAEELRQAAIFEPQYVVWHASHPLLSQVLGESVLVSNAQFLELLARLVRDVLATYQPPCKVCFENCFGVGLAFDDLGAIRGFLDALAGLPVGLVLDIGHHLNLHREIASPQAACEELLRIAHALTDCGIAVEALHLHWTPPDIVPPDAWERVRSRCLDATDGEDCAAAASEFFEQCDRHYPLSHPLLQQAVGALKPNYVVHELGAMSLSDHALWLSVQCSALRGSS